MVEKLKEVLVTVEGVVGRFFHESVIIRIRMLVEAFGDSRKLVHLVTQSSDRICRKNGWEVDISVSIERLDTFIKCFVCH